MQRANPNTDYFVGEIISLLKKISALIDNFSEHELLYFLKTKTGKFKEKNVKQVKLHQQASLDHMD